LKEAAPDTQRQRQQLTIENTVGEIMNTNNGEHGILVYKDLSSFRNIYPDVCKQMLEDNGIVVILTYFEPISRVFQYLTNARIDLDAHRRQGNLIVADAAEEFFGKEKDFLSFLLNLERKAKQIGKKYVAVIASMSVFFLYDKLGEMLEYEGLLDLSEVRNWKIICCYHKGDYDTLSEEARQELITRHNRRLLFSE
jgi:hypothetical protein